MFYYIEGDVVFAEPSVAVIDVGGVAYKMTVSYNTFASLAGRDRARLYTYLSVSENGIELYGFRDTDELDIYKLLTSISGVARAKISSGGTAPHRMILIISSSPPQAAPAPPGAGRRRPA